MNSVRFGRNAVYAAALAGFVALAALAALGPAGESGGRLLVQLGPLQLLRRPLYEAAPAGALLVLALWFSRRLLGRLLGHRALAVSLARAGLLVLLGVLATRTVFHAYVLTPARLGELRRSALEEQRRAKSQQDRSSEAYTRPPPIPYGSKAEIRALIDLHRPADLQRMRERLIGYVWKAPRLPEQAAPGAVRTDVRDAELSGIAGLLRIDALEIELEHGFRAVAYVLTPRQWNGDVFLYHQGHEGAGFVPHGIRPSAALLEQGYTVIGLSMPGTGSNVTPETIALRAETWRDEPGRRPTQRHRSYAALESPTFAPLKLFLHPVLVAVNYALRTLGARRVFMTGISGGGWTTTAYAALDPRIAGSFPVAGTLPMYLREVPPNSDRGDYEQSLPQLLNTANYLELYVLDSAGAGRAQVQILNQFDRCCFAGIGARSYEGAVREVVRALGAGGTYRLEILPEREHAVTDAALRIMLAEAKRLAGS